MSITWLVPVAVWGLAALAVPILVHLLTRQERRAIEFPSLRFLQATRLAATRQHRIRDWLLLAVRAATIAAAVAALAGPLLLTAARERSWSARTTRAIVAVDDAQAPDDEALNAFSSRVFVARARASEALRSAVEWLATQPPAARELLIVGDLREDTIDDADVARVPGHVGLRFAPLADATPTSDVTLPVLTLTNGGAAIGDRRVRLGPRETVVESGSNGSPIATPRLEVRASAEDQLAANAALTALLAEGIVADARTTQRVIVVWPGGAEPQGSDDTRVVHVGERPAGARAVHLLREIAAETLDDPTSPREPHRVSAADLARWSRPPGPVPSDAPRQDEGDRRRLWALALALLMVEWLLRRADRAQKPKADATSADAPVHRSFGEGGLAGQSLGGGGRVA